MILQLKRKKTRGIKLFFTVAMILSMILSTFSSTVFASMLENSFSISNEPEDYYGEVGDTATFTVGVTGGTEPYKYQWKTYNATSGWITTSQSGNKTETLRVSVTSGRINNSQRYEGSDTMNTI